MEEYADDAVGVVQINAQEMVLDIRLFMKDIYIHVWNSYCKICCKRFWHVSCKEK